MKYPTSCEVEKIVSKYPSRFAISLASLKKDELRATNGKAVVIIPVDRDKHDRDALIPPSVFPEARRRARKRSHGMIVDGPEVQSRSRAVRVIGKESAYVVRPEAEASAGQRGEKFPNIDAVVPKTEEMQLVGHFSGELMIQLLQAMGAHKSPHAVTLYASKKPDRPFKLEIRVQYDGVDGLEKTGTAVGVIMPMKKAGKLE